MNAAAKPRLAVWKFASCDGCQLSLLDCEDELLAVADGVQIALFPEASGQCYSGSAVVTPAAVPGVTEKSAPVLFFTATGPEVPDGEQHR